jgi:hypothetical protein
MIGLETNIFAIQNLDELSANYRLYLIKGLRPDQSEYYQNRQYLTNTLSRQFRSPILTIQRDDETYLVVRDDVKDLPDRYELVRRRVQFDAASDLLHLDFTRRNPENDEICVRFLQFALKEALYHSPMLWQPNTGSPFFEYSAINPDSSICHYRGYSVRVSPTQAGDLGIVVDVTGKFVANLPLPARLARAEFEKWKLKHFIYHFGERWYEIQAVSLDDRTCTEYEFKDGDQWTNLLDYALRVSRKPIPIDLAHTSREDSVILYRNSQNGERAAIASLCYPVFGTNGESGTANLHRDNILRPHIRRRLIHQFVSDHLANARYGGTKLTIQKVPEVTEVHMFNVPDQEFGQGSVLSVVSSDGAQQVSLDRLGSTRKALLQDATVGFYTRSPLDRQYIVLPASVIQSYGEAYLDELKRTVDNLYPQNGGYNPELIRYDDRGQRTFVAQGKAILRAMQEHGVSPGYALVMVHHTSDRKEREEDPLSGMVTCELRERFDVTAAVVHSKVPSESYQEFRTTDGSSEYRLHSDPKKRGRFLGYLRSVANSKVLLTNQKWPFVLKEQLHADVTIGIDVKQHTAGLVVVSDGGRQIRPLIKTSRQKERLLKDQMRDYLLEVLRQEATSQPHRIKNIVLHRDGRIYQPEIDGAQEAIAILRRDKIIDPDAILTGIDIPKSSPVHLRLFDVTVENGRAWVENPQVGCYYIVNNTDAYICSTGRAFSHEGTSRPLHIRRVFGSMSIEECLEDVYALTTLAWTKPDDCSRYPITLKLCDRYLTEDATDYDSDALLRAEMSDEEEEPFDE